MLHGVSSYGDWRVNGTWRQQTAIVEYENLGCSELFCSFSVQDDLCGAFVRIIAMRFDGALAVLRTSACPKPQGEHRNDVL